jgi:hypothetical protein
MQETDPQGQIIQSQNAQYFPEEGSPQDSFSGKLKKYWQTFEYYARQIWPWIYRLINFLIYNTLKVLKAIVKIGLQQTGLIKD